MDMFNPFVNPCGYAVMLLAAWGIGLGIGEMLTRKKNRK